ncbi:hypothetical protein [Acinetobacter sp. P1(2025)]|uniref:hypothetical protein n=1 Tax=Acinetobacter sp. P1(2025) TaxID=3446120 RepID=UPI003F533E38
MSNVMFFFYVFFRGIGEVIDDLAFSLYGSIKTFIFSLYNFFIMNWGKAIIDLIYSLLGFLIVFLSFFYFVIIIPLHVIGTIRKIKRFKSINII